jgi:hypothetical protein
MKFWICCLVTISCLQLASLVLTLPIFMTTGQTLWMTLIIIPFLSLSLMGTKTDANVMNISTGKNQIILTFDTVKYAIWCYGTRFVPTIAILILCHLLLVVDLGNSCAGLAQRLDEVLANGTAAAAAAALDVNHTSAAFSHCPLLPSDAGPDLSITAELLDLPQYLNFVFAFLYLTCTSMSFISRGHQLWERHPGHNKAWLVAVAFLFSLILLLTLATAFSW